MNKTFTTYHPIVNFAFFAGAIGLSMFMSHVLFSLISLILSLSYYLVLTKGKSKRFLLWYIVLFVFVVFFNGIMNTMGNTVLFVWLKNRPFTMEAVFYGAVTGIKFISVMLWFCCYNVVLTTDKFIYIFGRFAPSITMIVTMVLRLIPLLTKKVKTIIGVRNSIGKGIAGERVRDKVQHGAEILSIMTSCALEDAVVTADSMRSRGYVDSHHTCYHTYKWKSRDAIVGVVFGILMIVTVICVVSGATSMQFLPVIVFPQITTFTYLGITAYVIFLAVPLIIEIMEDVIWRISKSKI